MRSQAADRVAAVPVALPHPWPKDRRPRHLDAWLAADRSTIPCWAEVADLERQAAEANRKADVMAAEQLRACVVAEAERQRRAEQELADRMPASQGDIRELKTLLVELARRAGVAA